MAQQTSNHSSSDSGDAGRDPSRRGPTSSPSGNETSRVEDYLDRFARALTSGDTKTVATMWDIPAFVLGAQEAHHVDSHDEIEGFFESAREQYSAQGITDTRGEIERLDWLNDRLCLVTVLWPYLDAIGKELGAERSTYALTRGDDGQLKMRIALMHGVSTLQ